MPCLLLVTVTRILIFFWVKLFRVTLYSCIILFIVILFGFIFFYCLLMTTLFSKKMKFAIIFFSRNEIHLYAMQLFTVVIT